MGQWIKDLTVDHHVFADKFAERQSQMIPSENPDYDDLGQALPAWSNTGTNAILQPPKPEMRPSPQILERIKDRDRDAEPAD
jgi:hypothetical protein